MSQEVQQIVRNIRISRNKNKVGAGPGSRPSKDRGSPRVNQPLTPTPEARSGARTSGFPWDMLAHNPRETEE